MQTALSDACMFHALLFAASSHLDIIRGEHDNLITLFHHGKVIQLLNESLSNSKTGLQNSTIAATLILGHYDVRPL
jgi:hypothetical protein